MTKANKTKYAILGVLNRNPGSGYDIKKFCDKGISHFWNENFGHIYPVLKQLEEEGLITGIAESNRNGVNRKIYSLTDTGRKDLYDWLKSPADDSPVRLEILLKLFFAADVPQEYIIGELMRFKSAHERHLAEFTRIEAEYTANDAARSNPSYRYWLATLKYGMYAAEFMIKWSQETIESIGGEYSGQD